MPIWTEKIDLQLLQESSKNTMVEALGIKYLEVGDDYLKASMPVDQRTIQPRGILHGGASCALAESVGSVAANFCLDRTKYYSVGLDIHTSHIKMASSGTLVGIARPVKIGKQVQIWEIRIENEKNDLISLTRLTMIVLERR